MMTLFFSSGVGKLRVNGSNLILRSPVGWWFLLESELKSKLSEAQGNFFFHFTFQISVNFLCFLQVKQTSEFVALDFLKKLVVFFQEKKFAANQAYCKKLKLKRQQRSNKLRAVREKFCSKPSLVLLFFVFFFLLKT